MPTPQRPRNALEHRWSTGARQRVEPGDSTHAKSLNTGRFDAGMGRDQSPVMKLATALLAVVALALPAVAAPKQRQVALPVGHTMTLAMPAPVKSVRVSDPSLVEVKREGRKVMLFARAKGNTEATVTTADGAHVFRVYVAEDKYALPQ